MREFDSEELNYLAVAILASFRVAYGDKGSVSLPLSEVERQFEQVYGVLLPSGVANMALQTSNNVDDSFRAIVSRFAQTRYTVQLGNLSTIALNHLDAMDVWLSYDAADDDWMRECVETILGGDVHQTNDASDEVPASDRYVSLEDNQEVAGEALAVVKEVHEVVRGNNEITEDEKLIALSEIAIFEESLVQPRLALDLIERFLEFCRVRILKLLGETLSATLIDKLKALIAGFLGSL